MASDLTRAALLYRTGQARDFTLPDGEAVLGFGGQSAVHLPMEGVSRSHAKITFDGKDYWIEDLGSSNGTFLNGIPVVVRERLRHLDVLTLGRSTDLIFVRGTMGHARVTRLGIQAAWLEILNGEESGSRIEIPRGSITMGRSPSNGVVADSRLVSKIHARLERTALQIVLTDLHSSNGTFVGTERIESRVLKDGDEFTLGGSRAFRVRIEEGNVETSGVTPSPTVRSGPEQSLPSDWKTRIEWSPEEIVVWEDARKKRRPADTAKREEVPPGMESASAKGAMAASPAAKPAAAPPKSPAAPGKEPEARPAAAPLPAPAAATPARDRAQVSMTPEKAAAETPAAPLPHPPPSTPAGIGTAQPVAPPAPAITPAVSAEATKALPMKPAKAWVRLEGKVRAFSLGAGDHEVGRLPGMAICLDESQISRRHAVVRVTDKGVVVEDLRSGNGTFVNMERVTAPRRLGPGDLLQFGDIAFHVRFSSEPGDQPET